MPKQSQASDTADWGNSWTRYGNPGKEGTEVGSVAAVVGESCGAGERLCLASCELQNVRVLVALLLVSSSSYTCAEN